MQLRYNFRVYPTPGQRDALARAFGCARVVFNDALRARQTARENGQPYLSDGEFVQAGYHPCQGDAGAGVAG
ncbi:helix-turn-helix domain-containing protein [Lentzea californiensis]|uniref:helix-turn-helix domain-containing protein n=1 Tax=Lentzea californiensis TaxID=438851 RepID=UPI0021666375|nr:helix-turn-helix domain-containing protein [Lentzea californiensis]MCR3749235.1 Helix-turn-helix domain-containing protein [Lentzea californiensis]